jgi:hypothetical protein
MISQWSSCRGKIATFKAVSGLARNRSIGVVPICFTDLAVSEARKLSSSTQTVRRHCPSSHTIIIDSEVGIEFDCLSLCCCLRDADFYDVNKVLVIKINLLVTSSAFVVTLSSFPFLRRFLLSLDLYNRAFTRCLRARESVFSPKLNKLHMLAFCLFPQSPSFVGTVSDPLNHYSSETEWSSPVQCDERKRGANQHNHVHNLLGGQHDRSWHSVRSLDDSPTIPQSPLRAKDIHPAQEGTGNSSGQTSIVANMEDHMV